MQTFRHIAQNAGHNVQNDSPTMQNAGRTTHNVSHNTLNVCLGRKGGGQMCPLGPLYLIKLLCLEIIFRTLGTKKIKENKK